MKEEKRKAIASLFLSIAAIWIMGANLAIGASNTSNTSSNPCNPCSAKKNPCNPCNPCSAKKNSCNPCNPCSAKKNSCNPCSAKKNSCNPCGGEKQASVAKGKALFNDKSLSGTGALSCATCHNGNTPPNLTQSKSWPHYVGMAKGAVTLDQIIQLCLTQPMAGKAMNWNDSRLTSLALYLEDVRQTKNY